jgi:glutamyl-tRNA reductase
VLDAGTTMRNLLFIGTSYRRAPIEIRERLYIAPSATGELASRLASDGEAIVLATCNRTEIYLADTDAEAARSKVTSELARRAGMREADLARVLHRTTEAQVAAHLFRVSAGLDSLVPGDAQIVGQVRAAYEQAQAHGAVGPLLSRLFRDAIRVGKRVRAETAISDGPASVARAAADVVRRTFDDVSGRKVLLIGAGKMSEIVAASLAAGDVERVFVANRRLERAAALAARFGARAVGFDQLAAELVEADVVVSSTRCPRFVLTAPEVADVLWRRRGRPLLLVDIAVPRDLDPAIGGLPGCSLLDIDDLGSHARANRRIMDAELSHAEAIVTAEVEHFLAWRRSLEVVPAIVSLRQHAEAIRNAEMARIEGKLGGLTPAERSAVEGMTARILNKLLHTQTVHMKEAATSAEGSGYPGVLDRLFAPTSAPDA